jgi:hypothetical protein
VFHVPADVAEAEPLVHRPPRAGGLQHPRAKSPIAPIRTARPVAGAGTSRIGAAIAVSRSVTGRPAALSRSERSGGVEVGPTHQEYGRPVARSSVMVEVIRRSASSRVKRARATMLNVSSASPLSPRIRSPVSRTVMPGPYTAWAA